MKYIPAYSVNEEIANSVSHGIGALLSVAGLTLLLNSAIDQQDIHKVVSFSIYGTSLIILFLASTLYHAFSHEKVKKTFKLIDHCAIYLLIAGSYTPLMLVTLKGPLGYIMTALIWLIALAGILFKMKFGSRFKWLSLSTYLGMGFISLAIMPQLQQSFSDEGIQLLAIGGIVYCAGIIFYLQKKTPFSHAIWHLFVLGGACSHFFMILNYV
ncbi:PAQR family membrane homeostasis protein TrhA [Pseudoalteromonas denitrificans]|uniref:Hemolysin III n=1 Tax=Pseudoalteromonas denitrificans DSM 6059 TaxID=1123010 RepID=A0A1I1UHM0_9GAMM|nr:hemolysin III family protein [Pseudoalteromonas denitrificans]SFD70227.1 hemolysin III [Pseudoalteromonas denitrificans DSM 6059]